MNDRNGSNEKNGEEIKTPDQYITVQIETEQTGDAKIEVFYVPADLRVESGQVIKHIDPNGKSVLIFNSRLEVEDAVRSAGFLPKYMRAKI